MTVTPAYVFTIFMAPVAPIKIIPAFVAMVTDATREQIIALAVRGALQSTAIALLIALGVSGMQVGRGRNPAVHAAGPRRPRGDDRRGRWPRHDARCCRIGQPS